MKKLLFSAALLFLLAACAQPAEPAHQETTLDPVQARQQIEQRNKELSEAINAHNTSAIMALYTDDAISMAPNQPIREGKSAIEQAGKEEEAAGVQVSNLKLTTRNVEVAGNMAVEAGTYTIDVALPGGETIKDEGKYLTVWKNMGGTWKVHREIYNTSMPMQGMPGGEEKQESAH